MGLVIQGGAARNVVTAKQTADFTDTTNGSYVQLGTIAPSITIGTGKSVYVRTHGFVSTSGNPLYRLSIDSGGTLVNLGRLNAAGSGSNVSMGAMVTGLSAGAHTVKVEFKNDTAAGMNLRANTQPTLENLTIVLEEI